MLPASLETRIATARAVVNQQLAFFQSHFAHVESHWKSDNSRVTEADLTLSKTISRAILEAFPQDDFLSEEDLPPAGTTKIFSAEFAWVLDPIDGTNNFARGMPQCAISLALLQNGVPVYGIIFDNAKKAILEGIVPGLNPVPLNPENPVPAAPTGTLLKNGQPFVPAPELPYDEHSIISMHFPVPADIVRRLSPFLTVNPFRCQGSAALNLAYNAFGSIDGSFDFKTKVWDIAAAYVMLRAAGREIIFVQNPPFPLREVTSHMPEIRWFAGSRPFLSRVHELKIFA